MSFGNEGSILIPYSLLDAIHPSSHLHTMGSSRWMLPCGLSESGLSCVFHFLVGSSDLRISLEDLTVLSSHAAERSAGRLCTEGKSRTVPRQGS